MRTKRIAAVLFATCIAPFLTRAASGQRDFTWGACGHPQHSGVWGDPATQLATLEQRGLKSYRFDISLSTGSPTAAADLKNLIAQAKVHHITLHPILYVPFTWGDATDGGRFPNTDAGLEAQGYNRVYPFVMQFASEIHDWELENELSLRKGIKSGVGRSASDYETPLAHQWAAVLRGMSKAIHDVRAKTAEPLRTVIDTVYVDFGFVPFLESQGVSVDKLAYHYYYGADTNPYKVSTPDGKVVDLFAALQALGKPIIINEFNSGEIYAPLHSKPYDDAKALSGLKRHADYILGQTEANVEGAEFYELYDEPSKNAAESNFGLMKDTTHAKKQMLIAAVYACGQLSPDEQAALLSSGVFTAADLSARRAECAANR